MKVVLLLSVLVAVAYAASVPAFTAEQLSAWKDYKTQFNKAYSTAEEDVTRLQIFLKTKEMIEQHNARYEKGLESFKMGLNQFADMLPEEVPKGFGQA